MEIEKNQRGFDFANFEDRYGEKCSIQKSSLAFEEAIWFGIKEPQLTIFEDEKCGKYIKTSMPKTFMVSSQMHLTQDMVKDLLPYLIKFAETGELS